MMLFATLIVILALGQAASGNNDLDRDAAIGRPPIWRPGPGRQQGNAGWIFPDPALPSTSSDGQFRPGPSLSQFLSFSSPQNRQPNPATMASPLQSFDPLLAELNCQIGHIENYGDLCRFLNKIEDPVELFLLQEGDGQQAMPLQELIAVANVYLTAVTTAKHLQSTEWWKASNVSRLFEDVCRPALSCIVFCCQKNLIMFQFGCGNPSRPCPKNQIPKGRFKAVQPICEDGMFDFPIRMAMRGFNTVCVIAIMKAMAAEIELTMNWRCFSANLWIDYADRILPILSCLEKHFDNDLEKFVAAVGPKFDHQQFHLYCPAHGLANQQGHSNPTQLILSS